MASFKAKFPVLQELFAKNHRRGAFGPPSGARVNILLFYLYFERTPPPPGQQLFAKLGKMWWVGSQIWLNSGSNKLSQSRVMLANLGFELSRNWVTQEKLGVELSHSWVTSIVTWVRIESAQKIWVEHNPGMKTAWKLSCDIAACEHTAYHCYHHYLIISWDRRNMALL